MRTIRQFLFGTYVRGFVSSYLLFFFIGGAMLMLPISNTGSLKWIDAIFVSVSAMSTTGLSPIAVVNELTVFGKIVLAFIIQFGGIGLIMLVATFWLFTKRRIGFRERNMIMTDQNQTGREGIVRFIRKVITMIFLVEGIGFVTMFVYLLVFRQDLGFGVGETLLQSFFLTISMFTNAGFDIAPTTDSLFQYANDYFFQTLAMILMIAGAIGFWPLSELYDWYKAKRKKETFKFSLFTKMLVYMHLGIWILSAIIFFIAEQGSTFMADKSILETIYYSLFMSLTTRNAGFATMSMTDTSEFTQLIFSFLMFIGSSPNSAGGGIRTTTLLMVILGFVAFARGKDQVVIDKKAIKQDTIFRSMIVILGAILLVIVDWSILIQTEVFTTHEIFFEIASAFGTTGLSLGITGGLSFTGKVVIIITMFVGRVGILALLMLFRGKSPKTVVKYAEVDIIIG